MDSDDKIKKEALKLFVSYIQIVQKTIKETVAGGSLIILGPLRPRHFMDVIEKLERSAEFIGLGAIFSNAYGGGSSQSAIYRLQNYFRRSRVYLDIINGNFPVDINGRFEGLWSAFNERTVKEITIQPINAIDFHEDLIDFGEFKIQKFSKDVLDILLDQEVCEAFYPHAVVDTETFSEVWHIIEECVESKAKENLRIIELGFTWEDTFRVQRTFPDRTLQLLALFDWGNASTRTSAKRKEEVFWFSPFHVAFKHTVSSDLIKQPNGSPDLAKLYFKTYLDSNGEEVERPGFEVNLTDPNLSVFKEVVKVAQDLLRDVDLKKCNWEFLEVALGSLAKAFLAEEIEQLLWNIVALEALIGETSETTERMRRRLGLIWGERDEKKIEEISREVGKLYKLRSSLVHGSKFSRDGRGENYIYHDDLRLARDYARKTVLWFICYLSYIHKEMKKGSIPFEKYPKREKLVLWLDYQLQEFEHEGITIKMPENFPVLNFVGY